MAKDPAFLFYPNDWLGGTLGMTFEEKGAYMELLMLQFNRGHMTNHMIGQTVGQLWDKLQDKFIQDEEGKWYNERLEEEKIKRQKFTKSRRNNIKGVNQYTKNKEKEVGHKRGHMEGHTTSHMENENENINNKEIVFEIFKFFGFNEINHGGRLSEISSFIKELIRDELYEKFTHQWPYYQKVKADGYKHSFKNFINGAWLDDEWDVKWREVQRKGKQKITAGVTLK